MVSTVSLDTDEFRDIISVLTEMVEVKISGVRPICNLVSWFETGAFDIKDMLHAYVNNIGANQPIPDAVAWSVACLLHKEMI